MSDWSWALRRGKHAALPVLLESYEPDFFDAVELNLVDAPAGRGILLRWAASRDMREIVALLE